MQKIRLFHRKTLVEGNTLQNVLFKPKCNVLADPDLFTSTLKTIENTTSNQNKSHMSKCRSEPKHGRIERSTRVTKIHKLTKDNVKVPFDFTKVISLIKITVEGSRDYTPFFNCDYTQLRKILCQRETNTTPKSLPKQNCIYKTIPGLADLLEQGKIISAVKMVIDNFQHGNILTPSEFEQLISAAFPQKNAAYHLIVLYDRQYDITAFDTPTIIKMLKITYHCDDYAMFNRLFNGLLSICDTTPPSILSLALKVYLNSDNISMAMQIFNQSVMTERTLPCFVLDTYIRDLKRSTRNIGLCFSAYRLWLSRKFDTWPDTDALMYQSLKSTGSPEQLEWFMGSLVRCGRATDPEIFLVDLMLKLRDVESLEIFYSKGDYTKWSLLLESNPFLLNQFETKLLEQNLRNGSYERAVDILMKSPNTKILLERINKIVAHLDRYRQSEAIVEMLSRLHEQAELRIYPYYPEIIWHCLVKKYPEHCADITSKFRHLIIDDRSGILRHLLEKLRIKEGKGHNRSKSFPDSRARMIRNDLNPPANLPTVDGIESRIRCGINPTQRLVVKAMANCESVDEFNRIIALLCHHPKELSMNDLRLQIEIFWKQRQFKMNMPGGRSVGNFIQRALISIDYLEGVTLPNLMELISMSTKFNDFDLGIEVMKYIVDRQMVPSYSGEAQRLCCCLMNFFFKQKDFKNLIVLLKTIRESNISANMAFIGNLEKIMDRYSGDILRYSEDTDENAALKKKVVGRLIEYYNDTVNVLRRNRNKSAMDVSVEIGKDIEFIKRWIEDDFHRRKVERKK